MAEIARGERIAQLREARGLTQDEFPFALRDFNDGNHVASRRAVQSWEAGGGIKPKNAKIVADFFGVEVDEIAQRELAAPPPQLTLNGDASQLDRIERLLLDLRDRMIAIEAADEPVRRQRRG
jgi:transcriptional regulator with XRE-family HTH domain